MEVARSRVAMASRKRGAAEAAFQARAYPDSDIPLSATTNAVKAWNKLKNIGDIVEPGSSP